jgi:Fe-S oxidoreductase
VLEGRPNLHKLIVNGRIACIGLQDSCHLRNDLGGQAAPRQLFDRITGM